MAEEYHGYANTQHGGEEKINAGEGGLPGIWGPFAALSAVP